MHSFVALLAVTLPAWADSGVDKKKCVEVLESAPHCCKKDFFNKRTLDEDIFKECMVIPRAPNSCDREICIATKKGIITDDESINMDILQKNTQEHLADHKDLLEVVKEKCLEGDWQSYGAPDDCDIKKIFRCLQWNVEFGCTDFSDEGPCKGSKDLAKKCLELQSS